MAQSKSQSQSQSQPDKRQSGESEFDLIRGARASLSFVRDFVGQSLNGAIDALAGRQVEKEYLASVSSELARRYVRGREIMTGQGELKSIQSLSPEDRLAVRAYLKVRDLPKSLPFYDKETLGKDLDRELTSKAGRSLGVRREGPAKLLPNQAQGGPEGQAIDRLEQAIKEAPHADKEHHGESHFQIEPQHKHSSIDGEKNRAAQAPQPMVQSETAKAKSNQGEGPKGKGSSTAGARSSAQQPQVPTREPSNQPIEPQGSSSSSSSSSSLTSQSQNKTSGSAAVEPWPQAGNINTAKPEIHETLSANGAVTSKPSENISGSVSSAREEVQPQYESSSSSSSSFRSSSNSGLSFNFSSGASSTSSYGAEIPANAATSHSTANHDGAASAGLSARAFKEGRQLEDSQKELPRLPNQGTQKSEKYSSVLPSEKIADKKQETSSDKTKPILTKQQILSAFRQRSSAESIAAPKRVKAPESGPMTSTKTESGFQSGSEHVILHDHDVLKHPHIELTARASGRSIRAAESRIVRLLADDQLPLSIAFDDPRVRGRIKIAASTKRAVLNTAPRSSDRRYFITGPEIAFATIIALAAAAKARPDQPDILAVRAEPGYEYRLPDNAGPAAISDRLEQSKNNGAVTDQKKEISYSFFDTVAGDRPKPVKRVRPKVLVGSDDTLVSLAEQLFGDPQIAWLILDINNDSLTVIIMDGRSIVRLRCRQEIFIPVSQDIAEFAGRELPASSHLVTVVDDNQVDRQILDSAFDPLLGNAADQNDVELLDEFGELIITDENQ